jgi:hypothetical protein
MRARVTAPGTPLRLNALLRRITDIYVSEGYVTSRAYVPPQDTKDGRLTIVVIEGTVERVEVEPKGSVSAATAFPRHERGVFRQLRDSQQRQSGRLREEVRIVLAKSYRSFQEDGRGRWLARGAWCRAIFVPAASRDERGSSGAREPN